MSSSTHARLEAARTRRMLEDTAIAAVGGGILTALAEDHDAAGVWHAEVRCPDGHRVDVRLDRELETVQLVPARVLVHAAA